MDYKVVITEDEEADIENFIRYLIFEVKNKQAAGNVLNDFERTINSLATVAGSLKLCDNPKLAALGYRRINFFTHNYFMLYRIIGDKAIVDNIFHGSQDYENKFL